jgi:hypothetical protein
VLANVRVVKRRARALVKDQIVAALLIAQGVVGSLEPVEFWLNYAL